MTLSQEFQPMGVQLSLKAALPLTERLAPVSDRCSKTGPWATCLLFMNKLYFMSKTTTYALKFHLQDSESLNYGKSSLNPTSVLR